MITVGAVDDQGTDSTGDDQLASWSSRGTTQDGLLKPEILAPGVPARVDDVTRERVHRDVPFLLASATEYMQLGGTSMSAALVSVIVADILENQPVVDARPGQGRPDEHRS